MKPSRPAIAALLSALLAACSSGPPVPDWKMNAQSSVERFQAAYLSGNTLVEQTEFRRARSQVAGTGKLDLVARIELLRCATRVASLAFEDCAGFDALQADATAADRAYAAWLAGKGQTADAALLPEAQRAVAGTASDTAAASAVAAIQEPLSQLVAAGVLLRSGRATPQLLDTAVATASDQGWRRPLLAWLGVQRLRAEQAGDTQAALRIARRMAIVEQPLAP
jgi:hypothetical protein